jgi:hypothetical protein
MTIAPSERAAESALTTAANHTVDSAVSTAPKTRPLRGLISPVTMGRLLVRCISASMSRS